MDLTALLTIHDNVGDVLDKCIPKRVNKPQSAAKSLIQRVKGQKDRFSEACRKENGCKEDRSEEGF